MAAAILENGVGPLVLSFYGFSMSKLACVPTFIKIGSEKADLQHHEGLCSLGMLKWGKTLILGVKTFFLEERGALKTIKL